jgi:hypothetical protein
MPIYLDNAATSHPKPESVYWVVDHALREIGTSPGRGEYRRGWMQQVFRGTGKPGSIVRDQGLCPPGVHHSATEALNLAIAGCCDPATMRSPYHGTQLRLRPLRMAEKRGRQSRMPCGRSGFLNPVIWQPHSGRTPPYRPYPLLERHRHDSAYRRSRTWRARQVPLLVDAQSAGIIPIDVSPWGSSLRRPV